MPSLRINQTNHNKESYKYHTNRKILKLNFYNHLYNQTYN